MSGRLLGVPAGRQRRAPAVCALQAAGTGVPAASVALRPDARGVGPSWGAEALVQDVLQWLADLGDG